MIRTLFKYFFILTCIFYAGPASAATYWVSTQGSDSNPCTNTTVPQTTGAKSTIYAGIRCLAGGDTLYIRSGTYNQGINANNIFIPSGSSWSSPTTIASAPGEIATIKPNLEIGQGLLNITSITNTSLQYLVIDRIKFDGSNYPCDGCSLIGLGFAEGGTTNTPANHIRLSNSEIMNAPNGYFIATGAFAIDIQIINNKIHDSYAVPGTLAGGTACGQSACWGYPMYYSSSGGLIEGNEIYNFPSYGIHMYSYDHHPSNNIVRNNKIHDFSTTYWPTPPPNAAGAGDPRGGGILLASGPGNQAYNNIVYNGSGGMGLAYGCNGCAIYNNTVYNMTGDGIAVSYNSGEIIKNNIIYNTAGVPFMNWTNDTLTVSDNLCGKSGIGCPIVGDPKFVSASSNDFHLQSTSPAINSGVTLTEVTTDKDGITRPQGSAYDIGAYEYASGTTSLSGDINGDKIVNSLDWSLMSVKWLTNDANADLNKDGVVNSLDWSIMSSNWLKVI